jgi:hypothetical protein
MSGFDDIRRRISESEKCADWIDERNQSRPRKTWAARSNCPSDEDCAAYVERQLGFRRRLSVWLHVRSCVSCRVELLVLRQELDRQGLQRMYARVQGVKITRRPVAVLTLGSILAICATFGARQYLSTAGLNQAIHAEGEARAAFRDAITNAMEDLQRVETRLGSDDFEAIKGDAESIRTDAQQLRALRSHWEAAVLKLKARGGDPESQRFSPILTGELDVATALNDLNREVESYAEVELLMAQRSDGSAQLRRQAGQQSVKVLLDSSEKVRANLKSVEALSR